MALSAKLSGDDYRVYTLLGDGEIQEGQVWEAAMFAGFRKLDNLVVIVDNNGLQIDGPVDQVCSPYPINEKFKAFNFHVVDLAETAMTWIRSPLHLQRQETPRDSRPQSLRIRSKERVSLSWKIR